MKSSSCGSRKQHKYIYNMSLTARTSVCVCVFVFIVAKCMYNLCVYAICLAASIDSPLTILHSDFKASVLGQLK